MFLVITGLAQESRIAAGPGVSHVVCSGSDPARLRNQLSGLDSTGLRAVISFGIAGGLDPSLHPGDVVVATAVIAEQGTWKVPDGVVSAMVERVRASGIGVAQGSLVGVDEPILLPTEKAAVRRETDLLDQLLAFRDRGAARRPGEPRQQPAAGKLERDQHIAEHREMGEYRIALEHDAAVRPGLVRQRLAVDQYRAARGPFLAED